MEYDFPVYGTQGGGLVREVSQNPFVYVFVEEPTGSGLKVGDTMPSEWSIVPANDLARTQMDDELYGTEEDIRREIVQVLTEYDANE